eukprot:CAMPEP_0183528598 /NCGR_PEP_ID=MMETSP0371-20130417/22827_1 /TAXON_ID=268820 /ORGANISM="Peridinium aciculiferum, Strain PAER-2" /LENGTH=64 /DNA_ID=CAMNT_0025728249 /DNA_START=48 /DNA_END=239 /DNA_ORIENTATION=+
MRASKVKKGVLLLSSLAGHDEATAAAGILALKIWADVSEFVTAGICMTCDMEEPLEGTALRMAV